MARRVQIVQILISSQLSRALARGLIDYHLPFFIFFLGEPPNLPNKNKQAKIVKYREVFA
jgi:hypothetical protein